MKQPLQWNVSVFFFLGSLVSLFFRYKTVKFLEGSFVTKKMDTCWGQPPFPVNVVEGKGITDRASGHCYLEVGQPKIPCIRCDLNVFDSKKAHWQHNWCCSLVDKSLQTKEVPTPKMSVMATSQTPDFTYQKELLVHDGFVFSHVWDIQAGETQKQIAPEVCVQEFFFQACSSCRG